MSLPPDRFRRVFRRHRGWRLLLLTLLAGLILAWCNSAPARELAAGPAPAAAASAMVREFLIPVNFPQSQTISLTSTV
jgi:hypothetical protein